MATLNTVERALVERLFVNNGYVLDFTNRTFAEFFREDLGVDIYSDRFHEGSGSKANRLRAFIRQATPRAVAEALSLLWKRREGVRRYCSDVCKLPGSRIELSTLVERLGGEPLPQEFDEITFAERSSASEKGPTLSTLQGLRSELDEMSSVLPHQRGYKFEGFLTSFFSAWGLSPRKAFRNIGEQIDGSFWHDGRPYLLEAKWRSEKTGISDLHAFQGKVLERNDWACGLFVSYAGFTEDSLTAFSAKKTILMDGSDIWAILRKKISLQELLREKVRICAEKRIAFVCAARLFEKRADR